MTAFTASSAILGFLGRHGTHAVAISLFSGIALPPLAALFKPLIAPALFFLLCGAFLRVDPREARAYIARPRLALIATAWTMLVVPALAGGALALTGIAENAPGLYIALILQTAAPPVISSAALVALMGLDAALALVLLIACTIMTPLSATLFAAVFIGPSLSISPYALGFKLFALLAGAGLIAALVRRIAGEAWIARQAERIDGLNVILMFVFIVALMDGVAASTLADPMHVFALTALAFAIALGLAGLTALIFWRSGLMAALALGFSSGSRNMGLMLAAAAGAAPDLTWLYFALAQLPIFLLPQLLKPLVRWLAPTYPDKPAA